MTTINHLRTRGRILPLLAMATLILVIGNNCFGQGELKTDQPAAIQTIQWRVGPTKAKLANMAEIVVPEGYRFVDQSGARQILERMNNPVPKNLVGIMAPVSGRWFGILEYADVGYVKDADNTKIDETSFLDMVSRSLAGRGGNAKGTGMAADAVVQWELRPSYSKDDHRLEWAIRAGNPGEVAVNYSEQIFGRRGVIGFVVVHPYQDGLDLAPIREIAKGISFQQGEAYADYQDGDKVTSTGGAIAMGSTVDSGKQPEMATAHPISFWDAMKSGKSTWMRIGVGGAVFLAFGFGALVIARRVSRRKREDEREVRPVRFPEPAVERTEAVSASVLAAAVGAQVSGVPAMAAVHAANGNGSNGNGVHANGHSNGHSNGNGNGNGNGKLALNGKANGKVLKHGDRKKIRRMRFHTYYSDMVMNLTRTNYVGEFGVPLRKPDSAVNGSQPATVNGDSHLGEAPQAVVAETNKLIENQRKLIEDQRRLIEEMSKLYAEKAKLAESEARLIQNQAEFF